MSVYVDNFRVPATVGRVRARWSHLTATTPDELHRFAQHIGLKRAWFQARCKADACPTVGGVCAHFHYDVTDRRRTSAIANGALAVTLREFGALVSARRPQFRDPAGPEIWLQTGNPTRGLCPCIHPDLNLDEGDPLAGLCVCGDALDEHDETGQCQVPADAGEADR